MKRSENVVNTSMYSTFLGYGLKKYAYILLFLAELLNPNGNHGMGDAFLGQFLQLVIEERSNYIQSNKVSPEIVERYIGPNTEDEGGSVRHHY